MARADPKVYTTVLMEGSGNDTHVGPTCCQTSDDIAALLSAMSEMLEEMEVQL